MLTNWMTTEIRLYKNVFSNNKTNIQIGETKSNRLELFIFLPADITGTSGENILCELSEYQAQDKASG